MSGRVITIHQPEHMPWLGFFNKLLKADTFVILDSVQFAKNNWQNRNRIICSGKEHYLTVPVEMKGYMHRTIQNMVIANEYQPKWRQKYLRTISESYGNHPFFGSIFPHVEYILETHNGNICDLNIAIILYFARLLSAECTFIRASNLTVSGAKSDLVLGICRTLDARVYIAGSGGREYMDLTSFQKSGIQVVFNDYMHPQYPQYGRLEFIPYMSILDLFMNVSPDEARAIVLSGLPGLITEEEGVAL